MCGTGQAAGGKHNLADFFQPCKTAHNNKSKDEKESERERTFCCMKGDLQECFLSGADVSGFVSVSVQTPAGRYQRSNSLVQNIQFITLELQRSVD